MKAYAKHGQVILQVDKSHSLSREQTLELIGELALSFHLSGDISDPIGADLFMAAKDAIDKFRAEKKD